jgi:hypothetical protein
VVQPGISLKPLDVTDEPGFCSHIFKIISFEKAGLRELLKLV